MRGQLSALAHRAINHTDFTPAAPVTGIYTCGPTVYAFPHRGNMRPYVFADTPEGPVWELRLSACSVRASGNMET